MFTKCGTCVRTCALGSLVRILRNKLTLPMNMVSRAVHLQLAAEARKTFHAQCETVTGRTRRQHEAVRASEGGVDGVARHHLSVLVESCEVDGWSL